MTPLRHIVWDWNGTLLDDTQAGVNAVNTMLLARGLSPLDVPAYREVFGFPVRDFYRTVGFRLETEDWDAMAREFHDRFLSDTTMRLHVDTAHTLATLKAADIGQSVLSASEQTILETMLTGFGIAHFFANICGVDNLYGHSKLELGKSLLARLGLAPDCILFIGDSLHDHEVATALNTRCLLIAQGHQSHARLARSGAPVINSLADLPGWLSANVCA